MRFLAFIGFLAIAAAVAAGVFFFGGYFNVAATQRDPRVVDWALAAVRLASVDRYATQAPPFALDNPEVIHAGARAFFNQGCVNCHGAPGVQWEKFSEGLRPDPPDLTKVVEAREPRQLFWIIANGIRMTGMPSFALAGASDRELWAIVAFLKRLPQVTDAEFKTWVEGDAAAPTPNR